MTHEEFIALALDLCPQGWRDWPFAGDGETSVLRHRDNGRWFALLFFLEGKPCVNLKCEPMQADFWRRVYPHVCPGWHMNKTHWNTLILEDYMPREDLCKMILDSFQLTGSDRCHGKKALKKQSE